MANRPGKPLALEDERTELSQTLNITIELKNLEHTSRFVQALEALLMPGQFLALCGDLGAGKTTISRFLTERLNCHTLATSPTFSLFQEYDGGRLDVLHADLYRLGSEDELFDLGWDEMLHRMQAGLVIVEWADKFPNCWPQDHLRMDCEYGQNDDHRLIQMSAKGQRSETCLFELKKVWFTT